MSLIAIWLLMINSMIGAAIFGMPAEIYGLVGAFSPWLFVICALLVLPNMLCFAQLGSYVTGTGGPMLYATEAFGHFVGFQTGWLLYVARMTAFAANANLVVNSLGHFWGGQVSPFFRVSALMVICAGFALINIRGTKGAISSLGAITVLKLLPLLVLAGLGFQHWDLAIPQGSLVWPDGLGRAMPLAIYAYVGFESGLITAGEARNPRVDVPRALLLALLACCFVYFLIQLSAMSVLPTLQAPSQSLTDIAGALLGPLGALMLSLGIIASVTGHLMATMFAVPRITYRLGLEGYLPRWFGAVHQGFGTPHRSIAFMAVLAFVMAASGSFVWLAGFSVLLRLPVWIISIAAIPRLKRRYGDAPEAFSLPFGAALPILATVFCLILMTQASPTAFIGAALFLLVGAGLYGLARRLSGHRGEEHSAAVTVLNNGRPDR